MRTRFETPYVTSLGLAAALVAGLALNSRAAQSQTEATVVLKTEVEAGASKDSGSNSVQKKKRIVIEDLEPAGSSGADARREVAWLGVATEETSETLTSQLGLEAGEGLVITYLAPDSPAGKAGLEKNDVLIEFDGQTLVHPAQLRKLVHMRKEGDSVKLTFYRGGKKEDSSVKLGKTTLGFGLLLDDDVLHGHLQELKRQLSELPVGEKMREEMKRLRESLAQSGIDKESVQIEVKRSMEEARKAIQEALRQATNAHRTFGPAMREMREIVRRGVDVDKDATIVVKSHRQAVKTIVKTDDSGSYVVLANPKKHLTAHDKAGKLTFDGEIESAEQQERVPKEVWDKVQPMLEELNKDKADEPEAEAEAGDI